VLLKEIARGERIQRPEEKQSVQKWLFSQPPVKCERRRCFNMLSTSPPKTAKAFNFVGKSQTKKRATVGGRVDSRDGGLQGLRKGGEGVYLETFVDTIAKLEEGWAKP
jgi:hypothetical protein